MKKYFCFTLLAAVAWGCGTSKRLNNENIKISFLDDFVIEDNLTIGGTKVGGLSGIEYHMGTYYLVSDHPGNPRFYKAAIEITNGSIDTVSFLEIVELKNNEGVLKDKHLDLEAIRYDSSKGAILLTSEGAIHKGKDPAIFYVTPGGEHLLEFSLPPYFTASGEQKPRNNGVFEGLAHSFDQTGFWVGMELPLVKDGSKPKLFPTRSPVRITFFNKETGEAQKQFVMQLEHITKIPWLYFAVNGLTELLEYAPNRFLVLERAFSAGHGTQGNTVRLFDVNANKTTNTLSMENLRRTKYTAATKNLVFDFKSVRKKLKEQIIDNLEGMTFGPDLPNGNKTLLLVSDDNFSSLGRQITQIILLEVEIAPGIINQLN